MEDYTNKGGYGKRPLWQWILLYVIIAAVAYGLIYYFFFANKNNYQATNNPNNTTSPTITVSPANQNPATVSVLINNFAFSPSNLTVHKGDTVVWKNNDALAHTVTGDNGGPQSQSLNNGASYSYTFATIGTFAYHCSIHPNMKAVVQVIGQPAACNTNADCQNGASCLAEGPIIAGQAPRKVCVPAGQVAPL